jgi:quinoprotein glucose dehydrogenase
MKKIYLYLFLIPLFLGQSCQEEPLHNTNWEAYLGDKSSSQFTPLTQINKSNVKNLKIAWEYNSGDIDVKKSRTQIQCNPLVIDGIVYGSSPKLIFFALDAATGQELWKFKPFKDGEIKGFAIGNNRGLAYWTNGVDKSLFFTAGPYIFALDAKTGQLIQHFGKNGKVDLHEGLGRNVEGLFINSNTPGIIYKDKLILGSRVSESGGAGAVPGHIRAYNVKTGKQEWIFHTIPWPGEYGNDTWPEGAWQYAGGANAWAGFSVDEKRGLLFAPTGSASFDFYGGDRKGANLFANCLLALDAETGERKWHFQFVHHDLWDRDIPAPPNLVTVTHNGKQIDAVAQITKSSHVFLFDRVTGTPLFPIEEVPVPPSTLEGEAAWPTQPIPVQPPPFSRNRMREEDITQRSQAAHDSVKKIWQGLSEGPNFIPPSENGAIIFPGLDGGGEWGGAAFHPTSGNLIINASEMPWILAMGKTKSDNKDAFSLGKNTYNAFCQACHGKNLEGGDMFGTVPSLKNLKERLNQTEVTHIIKNGKGAMPPFQFLSENQINAIAAFLLEDHPIQKEVFEENSWSYPYYFKGYKRFKDQDGYPAITPPWGTLNAVNLNTGKISWKVTLGEYSELTEAGLPPTGSENYGGPVVSANGLIFIAATLDKKFRVFDADNGQLLYEALLPAAGFATPAVYAVDGKQYIIIACGGGKLGQQSGDSYIAFSL